MRTAASLLAPWLAVTICWAWLHNAWATLVAYHLLILLLSGRRLGAALRGWLPGLLPLVLPCALAGPVTWLLLPSAARVPLDAWRSSFGLGGAALPIMIPWYGLVHPFLEQAHWAPLRRHHRLGPASHFFFAGYHVIVLTTLMKAPWVAFCAALLLASSIAWKRMERSGGGLLMPVVSQSLADLGMILALLLRS